MGHLYNGFKFSVVHVHQHHLQTSSWEKPDCGAFLIFKWEKIALKMFTCLTWGQQWTRLWGNKWFTVCMFLCVWELESFCMLLAARKEKENTPSDTVILGCHLKLFRRNLTHLLSLTVGQNREMFFFTLVHGTGYESIVCVWDF